MTLTLNQKLKISSVIILVVAILTSLLGLFSYVESTKAVNKYFTQIDQQYVDIVNGKNINQPAVSLKKVFLANFVNSRYSRLNNMTNEYDKLIKRLKNYEKTIKLYNQIVLIYNKNNTDPNSKLDSQAFVSVNNLKSYISKYYSDHQEIIKQLDQLANKIDSSINFNQIIPEVNQFITNAGKWLNQERESIETSRMNFQAKVNHL